MSKWNFSVVLLVLMVVMQTTHAQTGNTLVLNIGDVESMETSTFSNQTIAIEMYKKDIFPTAFTNLGSGDVYYFLDGAFLVGSFDFTSRQYLGGWKLERIPDDVVEPVLGKIYAEYDISREITYNAYAKNLGCFNQHPLRYGDLESNGSTELILTLSDGNKFDLLVFSTEQKKIVFSATLAHQLAYVGASTDLNNLKEYWPDYGQPDDFQHPAKFYHGREPDMNKGLVSYAKLYFGEFNGDSQPDILVWRKLFGSRTVADPIKGFQLEEELLVHYTMNAGVYEKQNTNSEVIKSWLTDKQLTWKQGYPSESECEGQTGQPIPEFHDPLLNDPEVMQ